MSRDQRVSDNLALFAAQRYALKKKLPLIVLFVLQPVSRVRAKQHFSFMLEGLDDVSRRLADYGIPFVIEVGKKEDVITRIMLEFSPAAFFFDFSPLNGQKTLLQKMSRHYVSLYVVDTHNIVPVCVASSKQEWAARTLRPKIHKQLLDYAKDEFQLVQQKHTLSAPTILPTSLLEAVTVTELENYIPKIAPGRQEAEKLLEDFLERKLMSYAESRNDPTIEGQSNLSAYLHFGTLSSREIIMKILKEYGSDSDSWPEGVQAFIEEIVVRKELSDNFCYYNSHYMSLEGAPDWAKKTLVSHSKDKRKIIYSCRELESAMTHDESWNAAQTELLRTGKMHGYMRMYWAKKVLEWTETPSEAVKILVYLNDKYHLDGYDPNGYVGILWSVAGLHDRPWFERRIYGTVRYMNESGLRRKFDLEKYLKAWIKK